MKTNMILLASGCILLTACTTSTKSEVVDQTNRTPAALRCQDLFRETPQKTYSNLDEALEAQELAVHGKPILAELVRVVENLRMYENAGSKSSKITPEQYGLESLKTILKNKNLDLNTKMETPHHGSIEKMPAWFPIINHPKLLEVLLKDPRIDLKKQLAEDLFGKEGSALDFITLTIEANPRSVPELAQSLKLIVSHPQTSAEMINQALKKVVTDMFLGKAHQGEILNILIEHPGADINYATAKFSLIEASMRGKDERAFYKLVNNPKLDLSKKSANGFPLVFEVLNHVMIEQQARTYVAIEKVLRDPAFDINQKASLNSTVMDYIVNGQALAYSLKDALKSRADLNVNGKTASIQSPYIVQALEVGNLQAFSMLLNRSDIDLKVKHDGKTLTERAKASQNPEFLKLLEAKLAQLK